MADAAISDGGDSLERRCPSCGSVLHMDIKEQRVLVVEGTDEERFFGELIRPMGLQGIQILPIGGKVKLRPSLKWAVSRPFFVRKEVIALGVVRDADDDPKGAFKSVCEALREAGLPVPERPLKPVGDSPRVTVLILPREDAQGALEDLCLESVQEDKAAPCVDRYFDCLGKTGLPPPRHISKAKVQAFLASRQEEGKRLGEAAQAGYWPWAEGAFDLVRDFLKGLANLG